MIALTITSLFMLSLVVSLSYLIISFKALGPKWFTKLNIPLDILFTFAMPTLMLGSFAGMALAFLAGLQFTVISSGLIKCLNTSNTSSRVTSRSPFYSLFQKTVRKKNGKSSANAPQSQPIYSSLVYAPAITSPQ